MRVMVLVKASEDSEDSENGVMPTTEELTAMGEFNKALVEAGVMLDGDGLRPSSSGHRLSYVDGTATVTDGPFAETKELISGYWIWQVSSMDEAIAWLRRAPFRTADVEVRAFVEAADFGDALTPELAAQEDGLRNRR